MKTFDLQIAVYITSNEGDRLNVSETVSVQANDFLDVAKILGQFHDLATALRSKNSQPTYDPQRGVRK